MVREKTLLQALPTCDTLPVSLRPMKILHTVCLLALVLAVPLTSRVSIAADPPQHASGFAPLAPGERERMLEDAKTKRARAQALRTDAEEGFRRDEAACYDKIMVSNCVSDARKERTRKTVEARQLDVGADRMEREVKLRENAQRETQNAEKAPDREAASAEAAARSREDAEKRTAEQGKREAEHERNLQEAPARAAAESERREKDAAQAEHRRTGEAKRAAGRAESARKQRADLDRKAAEHAKRRAEAEAAAAAKAAGATPAVVR